MNDEEKRGMRVMRESLDELERERDDARRDAARLADLLRLLISRLDDCSAMHEILLGNHQLTLGDLINGGLALHEMQINNEGE